MSVSVVLSFVAAFCLDFCFAASEGKVSKSAPEAKAKMIDWASLEVVDYLRSGALIAAFIGLIVADNKQRASRSGRKTNYFVNAEIIAWFVGGLAMFFFPANLLGYMTTVKTTTLHEVEFQNFGAIMIGVAVYLAKIQYSIEGDGVVHSAWLVSHTVGSGSLLLIVLQTQFTKDFLSVQHLSSRALFIGLWFLSCLYQLFRPSNVGGSGSTRTALTSGINRYVLLDAIFVMPQLILLIAHPAFAYNMYTDLPVDDFLCHIAQSMGVSVLTYYMFTISTLNVDDDGVKKNFFLGRLVMLGMMFPVLLLHQWKMPLFKFNGFALGMGMMAFQAGYSYLAYNHDNGGRQKSR